jgi:hypothetical protein
VRYDIYIYIYIYIYVCVCVSLGGKGLSMPTWQAVYRPTASGAGNSVECRSCRLHPVNLLKPTGHVMHHQFNIEQLFALPTPYLSTA